MGNRRTIGTLAFLLCCLPATAQANSGTMLILAGMAHLLIGNAIIGSIEMKLLDRWFGAEGLCGRRMAGAGTMIAANYFSAWVGGLFLRHFVLMWVSPDLYSARLIFWLGVIAAYLMTLVLEWPFVALCFAKGQRGFKRVLKANATIQTITYVMLFGWYWMAQADPLYDEARAVPPSEISFPSGLRLYYISDEEGDVYTRELGKENDQRVFDLNSRSPWDGLCILAAEDGSGTWDLIAIRYDEEEGGDWPSGPVLHDMAATIPLRPGETPTERRAETWRPFSQTPRLAEAEKSDWEFLDGVWAAQGISGTNQRTGQDAQIAYETVFGQWIMRNAVHLPGDLVLFQMGQDQICVWDVEARKIALVARGRGPVVVVPKTDAAPPQPDAEGDSE